MVVLYGGFVCENACKRNLRGSNPRPLAVLFHRPWDAKSRGIKLNADEERTRDSKDRTDN